MTRRRLLSELPSAELSAWEAFYRIEDEDRRREEMKQRAAQGVKRIRSKRSRRP